MFAAEINAAPRKRLDIILRMNSLRRTSTESTRLLVSNLYSDRCSICYCNSYAAREAETVLDLYSVSSYNKR